MAGVKLYTLSVGLLPLFCGGVAPDEPPNGYACQLNQTRSRGLPFCNVSLPFDARVRDLVGRLTLEEKVGLLHAQTGTDGCAFLDAGVPRLDIPVYAWTEEANTGADSSCLGPEQCATTFPSPAMLAASFNASLWHLKGEIISQEVRALNNAHGHRGCGPPAKIGVNEWGPNINLIRDARFGRNSELPSEDPFLTGSYAVEFVKGLQQGPDKRFVKVQATLKHYTAYSVEDNRGHDNANISAYDMEDSFLRQFEMGFVEGRASGVMCSYNLINGTPNCASPALLNDRIRSVWHRPDALIVSDSGALGNMHAAPTFWSPEEVVSNSFNAGLDLNTGNKGKDGFAFLDTVLSALTSGSLSNATLDTAVGRAIMVRMTAGAFDPTEGQEYTKIGADQFNASAHWEANLDAASQGLVLLRNEAHTLPLRPGVKLAVVGPHAVSDHGLFSDYYGDQVCWDGQPFSKNFSCIQTIGAALMGANVGGNTVVEKGVSMVGQDSSHMPAALAAVRAADVVVLAIGTDVIDVEHEGTDRSSAGLPDGSLQEKFALEVLKAASDVSVPVVLLLLNGGAVSIDALLAPVDKSIVAPKAVIEAFFPGHRGAKAVARHMFGYDNRWGRLPYSILTKSSAESFSITDYTMHNRTYRYLASDPADANVSFPFGFGLSYVPFSLQKLTHTLTAGKISIAARVANNGNREGDAVIMAFFKPLDAIGQSSARLLKQLFAFKRVSLAGSVSEDVAFDIDATVLALVGDDGQRTVSSGKFEIRLSIGDGNIESDIVEVVSVKASRWATSIEHVTSNLVV